MSISYIVLVFSLWVFYLSLIRCSVTTFTNTNPITINDHTHASPYPSTITASGLPSVLQKVTVTIEEISHTFYPDVEIFLQGPNNIKIYLMNDVGPVHDFNTYTLNFDDSAALSVLNFISTGGGTLTFSPATYVGSPLVSTTHFTLGGSFNGINPNGVWSLYVDDDAGIDVGIIQRWSVTLDVDDTPVPAPSCGGVHLADAQKILSPIGGGYETIQILGLTPSYLDISGTITQNEPPTACPDAFFYLQHPVVKKERLECNLGRVYSISFVATDAFERSCEGLVKVCVPKESGGNCDNAIVSYHPSGCP